MVSISIDPENDTPARLKEYAAKNKAGAQWTFLTGSLENSVAVQKAFGVFAGEKMNHKPITFMKAKGSDKNWVRLEGLAEADQILNEYDKVGSIEANRQGSGRMSSHSCFVWGAKFKCLNKRQI